MWLIIVGLGGGSDGGVVFGRGRGFVDREGMCMCGFMKYDVMNFLESFFCWFSVTCRFVAHLEVTSASTSV